MRSATAIHHPSPTHGPPAPGYLDHAAAPTTLDFLLAKVLCEEWLGIAVPLILCCPIYLGVTMWDVAHQHPSSWGGRIGATISGIFAGCAGGATGTAALLYGAQCTRSRLGITRLPLPWTAAASVPVAAAAAGAGAYAGLHPHNVPLAFCAGVVVAGVGAGWLGGYLGSGALRAWHATRASRADRCGERDALPRP